MLKLYAFPTVGTISPVNFQKKADKKGAMTSLMPVDTFKISFAGNKSLTNPSLTSEQFKEAVNSKLEGLNATNKAEIVSELTEVLDKYLQEEWTKQTQPGKKAFTLQTLKTILGDHGQGNTVIAQINTTPGDLEGNAKKIIAYIDAAEKIGADTVVFPELALMGYPIGDIIKKYPFIVKENEKWLHKIAEFTKDTRAIVGFIEPRTSKDNQLIGKDYFNSVAILGNGEIEGIVRKTLLPTYGEFNEYRYCEPSPVSGVLPKHQEVKHDHPEEEKGSLSDIHGHKYGISICEDIWNDDNDAQQLLYKNNPISEMARKGPDMLLNCSSSPTRTDKEPHKNMMLSKIADKYNIPLVYVNQVGAVDDNSFDGASRVYGTDGSLVGRAKAFDEQFLVVNPLKKEGKVYPINQPTTEEVYTGTDFSLNYGPDLERTYKTIVQGIKDYFGKNGFKKAVLGLSGGMDSTLCAVLLADAIGPQNVTGISMPSRITSDGSRNDAKKLAENLGINFTEIPIGETIEAFDNSLRPGFKSIEGFGWEAKDMPKTLENIQSRTRASILWSAANQFMKVLPISTSDKSEMYIGYTAINGDMTGGFAPIADVTKTKIYALAEWLNENRPQKNAIPREIIEKPPTSELALSDQSQKSIDSSDEVMPIEFLDEIIWNIEHNHASRDEMLKKPFTYEKQHPITQEEKEEWVDKFYGMMKRAVFKWKIAPPTVIVDKDSICSKSYQQPITAKINWRELDDQAIKNRILQTAESIEDDSEPIESHDLYKRA